MVGRADTRHLVAAEEKRVLPGVCQRSDAPFGKAIVYRVVPVLPVKENLVPEMVEITDCLFHQASVPQHVSRFYQVKQALYSYYYFRHLVSIYHFGEYLQLKTIPDVSTNPIVDKGEYVDI